MMIYIDTRFSMSENKFSKVAGVSRPSVEFWRGKGMPYIVFGNIIIDLREAYDWLLKNGYHGEYLQRIKAEIERRERSNE